MHHAREVSQVIRGMPAADGDGVKLTRLIGSPYLDQLDPFLLLDAFGSSRPTRTGVLRQSPICSPAACVTKTVLVMPALSKPEVCSG